MSRLGPAAEIDGAGPALHPRAMTDPPASLKDPVVARLLRFPTRLREGGDHPVHEVLATYWTESGIPAFAFCRHGLLLNPGSGERYIAFTDIEDAGYYNREMVERAKTAHVTGVSEPLSIRLHSGEEIDLPMELGGDGMPDLLTIASLIHQRVVIHRAKV